MQGLVVAFGDARDRPVMRQKGNPFFSQLKEQSHVINIFCGFENYISTSSGVSKLFLLSLFYIRLKFFLFDLFASEFSQISLNFSDEL
jgi:hypothetical protein